MITEGEAEAEILCVSWIGGLVTHFNPLRFHHLEGTGDKLTWQRKYLPIYSWKVMAHHMSNIKVENSQHAILQVDFP